MNRRRLLSSALLASTAAAVGCGGPSTGPVGAPAVHTAKRVRWRLASSFPRSLDTIYGAAEVMAERVKVMTDGRLEIQCYPAGEIVPGLQVMDAVQQGTVHVGHTASYYYIGKHPALAFDTCVPFGLNARQQAAWLLEAGGLDLVRELFAAFDVVTVPGGNTGVQMGGWFKGQVDSLEALKGLKMRIPGMGGTVMEALGVAAQTIAGGEIYTALERGAIDAADWVGPSDDEKLGFHKVAKNYYYPGWWEPGPSLSYYFHKPSWDALPASDRDILAAACHQSGITMLARYDAANPPALARILEAGVSTRRFSDDILARAREASTQMLEDDAARDPSYRKVYDHWRAFRDDSFRWFSLAELAYAQITAAPSPAARALSPGTSTPGPETR